MSQNFKVQRILEINSKIISEINDLMDEGTSWNTFEGDLFLQDKNNALFGAFMNGKLVGFLSAYRLQRIDDKKSEVLIYEVSVHEDFRKLGIGKALIQKVKDWAKELNADNAWVLTYDSNVAAMNLYKSSGGEEDQPGTRMFTFIS